jgi:hypothetical protein
MSKRRHTSGAMGMMTATESLHKMAEDLAFSLGIPFYIRNGKIYQHGPGERIEPKPNSRPDYSMHTVIEESAKDTPA